MFLWSFIQTKATIESFKSVSLKLYIVIFINLMCTLYPLNVLNDFIFAMPHELSLSINKPFEFDCKLSTWRLPPFSCFLSTLCIWGNILQKFKKRGSRQQKFVTMKISDRVALQSTSISMSTSNLLQNIEIYFHIWWFFRFDFCADDQMHAFNFVCSFFFHYVKFDSYVFVLISNENRSIVFN